MKPYILSPKFKVAILIFASFSPLFYLSAQTAAIVADSIGSEYHIEYRLRNGKTGFEAALFTPSTPAPGQSGGGDWQLDPPGAPVWNTAPNSWGDIFICNYFFEPDSAKSTFQVDFNRDGDYLDSHEMTVNYADSILNENLNLVRLFVQGEATGLIAQVFDFSVNGTILGDFYSDGEEGLEIVVNTGATSPADLQVDFGFSFSGGGSQERPRVQVYVGRTTEFDSVPIVPVLDSLPEIVISCRESLIISNHYPAARTILGNIQGAVYAMNSLGGYPYTIVWMYDDGNGNTLLQEQVVTTDCESTAACASDINYDGVVNAADLGAVIDTYGQTCP